MKISELNSKTFLGEEGAKSKSYVLINYDDTATNSPVTCKTSIETLAKEVASQLGLPVYDPVNRTLKAVTSSTGTDTYAVSNDGISVGVQYPKGGNGHSQLYPILYETSEGDTGFFVDNNSKDKVKLLTYDTTNHNILFDGSSILGIDDINQYVRYEESNNGEEFLSHNNMGYDEHIISLTQVNDYGVRYSGGDLVYGNNDTVISLGNGDASGFDYSAATVIPSAFHVPSATEAVLSSNYQNINGSYTIEPVLAVVDSGNAVGLLTIDSGGQVHEVIEPPTANYFGTNYLKVYYSNGSLYTIDTVNASATILMNTAQS